MGRLPLILLLLYPFKLFAQSNTDTIHWKANYKLTWNNYQGTPDTNSQGGAGTVSGFVTRSKYTSDTTISIRITAVFYKNQSWQKTKWQTPSSLRHEQGHFDITEVFARKANIAFRKYKFNKTTLDKDIERIFDSVVVEKNKMHRLYDKETDYHRNVGKQEEWERKIAAWLKENKDDKQ